METKEKDEREIDRTAEEEEDTKEKDEEEK